MHEYAVLDAKPIKRKDGKEEKLIQLRNPHGMGEFKGNYSDKSKEWEQVPEDVQEKIKNDKNDGKFWMNFPDMKNYYSQVRPYFY